jgi:hypothetical protein
MIEKEKFGYWPDSFDERLREAQAVTRNRDPKTDDMYLELLETSGRFFPPELFYGYFDQSIKKLRQEKGEFTLTDVCTETVNRVTTEYEKLMKELPAPAGPRPSWSSMETPLFDTYREPIDLMMKVAVIKEAIEEMAKRKRG